MTPRTIAGTSQLSNSRPGVDPVTGAPFPNVFPETDAGDSIIGTFTAAGTSLSFDVFGSIDGGDTFTQGDGRAQINAIQLRDLGAVPEPSSLVVLGLMSVATVARRRK